MTEPIPDDSTQRRTWLIAGVLSLVVVFVGVGVAFAVMALRRPAPKPPISYTPAEQTSATASPSGLATSSANSTSSASATSATGSGGQNPSPATSQPGQIVRTARIAYRLGGQVWVSGEDGSAAKAVAVSTAGAFALSPDGKTLVIMEGSNEAAHALLIDVDNTVQSPLALATELPTWSPDSSWLAYTAGPTSGAYSVRRVNRDGSGDEQLIAKAAEPAISPDGKRIAYTTKPAAEAATQSVQVYDIKSRSSRTVPKSVGAETFSFASGGVLYFAKAAGDRSLWMTDRTLTQSSAIASMPAGTETQAPGDLYASPDGVKVLFAMTGDDGYSAIVVADAARKTIKPIKMIKDATPIGWSLDGSSVFYIFGNAFQNEATSLYRMRPDGSRRAIVVSGAGA